MTKEDMKAALLQLREFVITSQNNPARELAYELIAMQEIQEDVESLAKVYSLLAVVYWNHSNYVKALEFDSKALHIWEELEDKEGIATNLGNIGNVYSKLSDYQKAIKYYTKALHIKEELGNKSGIASNLGNIGIVYQYLLDYPKALEYHFKALNINEEIEKKSNIAVNLMNIGLVYMDLSDYPKALEYQSKALKIYDEIGDKYGIGVSFLNIGNILAVQESPYFDNKEAEKYYQKSLILTTEIGAKDVINEIFEKLHILRLQERNFEEALEFQTRAILLEKEIISIEAKKQAERFDSERKTAEREKQIAVERAETLAVKRILHNILPINIAERILQQETFIADHFDSASVLFMDLVGFTTLASIAPPKQLVYLLDAIFQKADDVVEQFGLEKIKTIGDGYLAVANVTSPLEHHQKATALAALQLLEAMKNFTVNIPSDLGNTDWIKNMNDLEIRIGIHAGEVVAGIIGKNKYTYDLWGDAVNIASRMESNSEAGRIHISEEFAQSIEQHPGFKLIPRGEITIKGKGVMNTYWLEKGGNAI